MPHLRVRLRGLRRALRGRGSAARTRRSAVVCSECGSESTRRHSARMSAPAVLHTGTKETGPKPGELRPADGRTDTGKLADGYAKGTGDTRDRRGRPAGRARRRAGQVQEFVRGVKDERQTPDQEEAGDSHVSVRTRLKPGIYQDSVRLMRISDELAHLPGVTQSVGGHGHRREPPPPVRGRAARRGRSPARSRTTWSSPWRRATTRPPTRAVARAEELLAAAAQPREGDGGRGPRRRARSGRASRGSAARRSRSSRSPASSPRSRPHTPSRPAATSFSSATTSRSRTSATSRQQAVASAGSWSWARAPGRRSSTGWRSPSPTASAAGRSASWRAPARGSRSSPSSSTAAGSGISQAIGTGGRDLRVAVGGLTTRLGLELPGGGPGHEGHRPPLEATGEGRRRPGAGAGRASAGSPSSSASSAASRRASRGTNLTFARTLEEAAHARAPGARRQHGRPVRGAARARSRRRPRRRRRGSPPAQKYLRGLYSGGSLCDESLLILARPGAWGSARCSRTPAATRTSSSPTRGRARATPSSTSARRSSPAAARTP